MKISCVVITQISRLFLLEEALRSFSRQLIDNNEAEVVIVHDEGSSESLKYHQLLERSCISGRVIKAEKNLLGTLRNVAIENSQGDIICQWDDDDIYHPLRISEQILPLVSSEFVATTLESQICWFLKRGDIYIRKGGKEGIHGTITFRKNIPLRYDGSLARGEDTRFIDQLLDIQPQSVSVVRSKPYLYVRRYHGENTWDYFHHYGRLKSQAMNSLWIEEHSNELKQWLDELQISHVTIRSNNDEHMFSI